MPLISNPSFPGRMTNKNESSANNRVRRARRLSLVLRSWFLRHIERTDRLEFEYGRGFFFNNRVEIRHLLSLISDRHLYSKVIL